jgi:formylglycine-generating enzyme required for sulfatase activity
MKYLLLFLLFFAINVSIYSLADKNTDLIFIEGDQYLMGIERGEDNPVHLVRVNNFFLSKYEVTMGEWSEFTAVEPNPFLWGNFEFTSLTRRNIDYRMPSNWAMYYITWYDAIWYCNWRSIKEGFSPAYKFDTEVLRKYLFERGKRPIVEWDKRANGYRLPTEAEWEYAAKGGKAGKGKNPLSINEVEIEAWTITNSDDEVHAIGLKRPNPLGIHDMLGNVAEWVWDYYDSRYYKASPRNNPIWNPSPSMTHPVKRTDPPLRHAE